jgi:hypothetical protein
MDSVKAAFTRNTTLTDEAANRQHGYGRTMEGMITITIMIGDDLIELLKTFRIRTG